jgi:hypothetical protein
MDIKADSRIPFGRDVVFRTYRDALPLLVPFLPNISSITVAKRAEEGPGLTRMLNVWKAKGEIPTVAQAVIKPEMLEWNDHALWNENDWTCEWRVETKLFTENVSCSGKNRFVPEGDGAMRLEIRGNLDVNLKGIPGVPRFLAGTVAPVVEKFIVTLLTPNLTSVSQGLERYLRESAK